jgi:pyrroline-5-carboxylate reductase
MIKYPFAINEDYTMTHPTIALIGAGNMGASLIGGLVRHGFDSKSIYITDPNPEKRQYMVDHYHVNALSDTISAISSADVIIIAVKPQHVKEVMHNIKEVVNTRKPLIISVATGITAESMSAWLGDTNIAIVRCMPNTPALIGCGMTALHANAFVTDEQCKTAESILKAAGEIVWLKEPHLMDAVTALSGSGPAYFFLIMEALQQAGEALGLPAETARQLTLQTALGAAKMAIESQEDLVTLRKRVTSPGGTTERGIAVMEDNHIRVILKNTLVAAKDRSRELAEQLGENK